MTLTDKIKGRINFATHGHPCITCNCPHERIEECVDLGGELLALRALLVAVSHLQEIDEGVSNE